MNCPWLSERLPRPEVELWRNGRPSHLLLEHARECPECGHMIEKEAQLKAVLLATSESTRHVEASANVHERLIRELELRHAIRAEEPRIRFWTRHPNLRWTLAAAAMALVAGVAVLVSLQREERAGEPTPPPAAHAAPRTVTPTVVQTVQESRKTLQASAPKKTSRAGTRKAASAAAVLEAQRQYYPLLICDQLACGGDAVELQMKVAAPSLWLAGGSSQTQGRNAQLLVGEDGMVRAIKFVE